jgi:hypothetical protein
MSEIKCLICGDKFQDQGSHPVIDLKRACIREAYMSGWWDMTREQLWKMRSTDSISAGKKLKKS